MIGVWMLAGVAVWAILLGLFVSPWLVIAGGVVFAAVVVLGFHLPDPEDPRP